VTWHSKHDAGRMDEPPQGIGRLDAIQQIVCSDHCDTDYANPSRWQGQ
jgi:hypothetical protein